MEKILHKEQNYPSQYDKYHRQKSTHQIPDKLIQHQKTLAFQKSVSHMNTSEIWSSDKWLYIKYIRDRKKDLQDMLEKERLMVLKGFQKTSQCTF